MENLYDLKIRQNTSKTQENLRNMSKVFTNPLANDRSKRALLRHLTYCTLFGAKFFHNLEEEEIPLFSLWSVRSTLQNMSCYQFSLGLFRAFSMQERITKCLGH